MALHLHDHDIQPGIEPPLEVIEPVGVPARVAASIAPALVVREALKVALVSNGKVNGSELLAAIADELRPQLPGVSFEHYRKPSVSVPPISEDFDAIVAGADAVVCAIGDCGSCSSRTMRDAIDFELAGVPAVAVIADAMISPVDYMRRVSGLPDYPFCVTEFPVGNLTEAETRERAKKLAPEVLTLLTSGRPEGAAAVDGAAEVDARSAGERKSFATADAAIDGFYSQGWTDGLPVVLPTPARVEAMLASVSRAADEILFELPTRHGLSVTVELAAANAVMAGCAPEHFPVVVAAVEALGDPAYNLHGHSATLAGAQQVVIVNGSVRQQLSLNCADGALGPGTRANAAIGRAVRLVIRNGCHSVHGEFDRASFGHPGRYSWCFGEAEEQSPWTPLTADIGYGAGTDAVTLYATVWQTSSICHSRNAEELLDEIATLARTACHNNWLHDEVAVQSSFYPRRPFLFVTGHEHASVLVSGGYERKDEVEAALYRRLSEPRTGLRPVAIAGPDNVHVVYVGASGMQQTWFFAPFQSHELVSRRIGTP